MKVGANMRVLLVDDDADILVVGTASLRKVGGFDVVPAASGAEAVRIAADVTVDVVLLDMMMPGLDGMGTLTQLLALPSMRSVPILFMTAKVQQSEVDKYIRAGAAGVIHKPFDPLELPGRVAAAVRAQRGT